MRNTSRAFTLIELLAVIAIIGVLVAILIPVLGRVRESTRSMTCVSNLRQIGAGFQLYAADNHGLYPAPRLITEAQILASYPGYTKNNPPPWANPTLDNWQAEINPYVFRTDKNGQSNIGIVKGADATSNIAHCPSFDLFYNETTKLTSMYYRTAGYGMNFHINVGGADLNTGDLKMRRFPAASINNSAKTVLVADSSDYHIGVDTAWSPYPDTDPASPMGKPDGYNSGAPYRHGNTANYLFCDGHVVSLSPAAALAILPFKS